MRKAIMRMPYLENVYFKQGTTYTSLFQEKTDKSLGASKKQNNYCSRVYKKERKNFFNKLNPSCVNDSKLFWKTAKPLFLK